MITEHVYEAEIRDACDVCGSRCADTAYYIGDRQIGCDVCAEWILPADAKQFDLTVDIGGCMECPNCGQRAERLYYNGYTDTIEGCDACIDAVTPESTYTERTEFYDTETGARW